MNILLEHLSGQGSWRVTEGDDSPSVRKEPFSEIVADILARNDREDLVKYLEGVRRHFVANNRRLPVRVKTSVGEITSAAEKFRDAINAQENEPE